MWLRAATLVALMLGTLGLTPAGVAATTPTVGTSGTATDTSCAQVIVYVVRGSGEAPQPGDADGLDDPGSYADTWDAFDPVDPDTGGSSIDAGDLLDLTSEGKPTVPTRTPFLYDLVEKIHERVGGQVRLSWSPVRYRAIPATIKEAPLWLIGGYGASVSSGVRQLHHDLERQWELCGTRTRYVLAGYSQGADVVTSYLRGRIVTQTVGTAVTRAFLAPSAKIAGQIAAVALIADPNHDPQDAESYSDVDKRLAQTRGLKGIFRGVPRTLAGITDSFCIAGDLVCGQGTIPSDSSRGIPIHSSAYRDFVRHPVSCAVGDETISDESAITCMADRVVWRLGVRNLVLHPPGEAESAPGLAGRDVAFFIDTTGSMSDDIDAARRFAENQAGRIVALDGRVALVQYRDSVDTTPVEIVTPFTSDMAQFQDGLSTLYADGGGDDPEGLLHALMTGMNQLSWQYGASKAAVILTDADFHEPDLTGGETIAQVERRSLQIDPINIFPVVDGGRGYFELARRTSGQVILNHDGRTEEALGTALDTIADRPTALLTNGTYVAAAGRSIHFDASASSAVVGSIREFRWDFDGDGTTDDVTTSPTVDHTYPPGYSGLMQVLVVDDQGRGSNASAAVLVDETPVPGLVPRVPGATSMTADARIADDHVRLAVSWSSGAAEPERWVVSVDGDPVDVLPGSARETHDEVLFQKDPWRVTVTPMDADGNYGPSVSARLAPLTALPAWYARPLVWSSAGGGFAIALVLLLWLPRRGRPLVGPQMEVP
ncbi:hypothetical protein GCM10027600_34960 [Nocardioides ginsengisegetis]